MSVDTAPSLTPELLDLMEHEKVIEQGLAGFLEVGNALLAIKIGRKYRAAGHATFEAYCEKRWTIVRSRGYQLVQAAATVERLAKKLSTAVDTPLPERERQVRELHRLPEPERADAWVEAVEVADGGQPTAAEVAEVVERRRAPQPVPKLIPTGGKGHAGPPHPATYPLAVLDVFRELLAGHHWVLDPFAGIGGIHALRPDHVTWGIEIEPEWALVDDRTIVGDARMVAELLPGQMFDAIATSPAYGNRLADAFYNAYDPEARRTYALDLGRPLDPSNGAGMHFGTDGDYEQLHREVWRAVVDALRPAGLFLLNCKDFQRDGRVVPMTGWHVGVLADLGLRVVDIRTLPAAGLPYTTAKPLSELVVAFRKEDR